MYTVSYYTPPPLSFRLIATVDRVYKKLYITSSDSISERPTTVKDKGTYPPQLNVALKDLAW